MSDILAYTPTRTETDKLVMLTKHEAAYLLPNVEKVLRDAQAFYTDTCQKHGDASIPAEMSANHVDTLRRIYNTLSDQVDALKRGA